MKHKRACFCLAQPILSPSYIIGWRIYCFSCILVFKFGWNRMPTKMNKLLLFFQLKYCRDHKNYIWFEKKKKSNSCCRGSDSYRCDITRLFILTPIPPCNQVTRWVEACLQVLVTWGEILSVSSVDKGYRRLVLLCSTDIWIDIKHGNNGGGLPSWRHRKAARGEQDSGAAGRSGQLVPGSLISQLESFTLRLKV